MALFEKPLGGITEPNCEEVRFFKKMDSNKILVVFVVGLVGLLAFPIVANKMRHPGTGAVTATATATAAPATAPAAVRVPGGAPVPVEQLTPQSPELKEPPLFNEQNLVNSTWQFFFQTYKVKMTLAPNGVLYVTHPMARALTGLDYIEGRWNVQGNKLHIHASPGGNDLNYEFIIGGTRIFLLKEGNTVGELERF